MVVLAEATKVIVKIQKLKLISLTSAHLIIIDGSAGHSRSDLMSNLVGLLVG